MTQPEKTQQRPNRISTEDLVEGVHDDREMTDEHEASGDREMSAEPQVSGAPEMSAERAMRSEPEVSDAREASSEREMRDEQQPGNTVHSQPSQHSDHQDDVALLEDADSERFRGRWHDVQAAFVDDPRNAVQDADQLVAELMQTLAATFAERKRSLEEQWHGGGEAQTEDLRLALRSYRSFFDQLLAH